jgi:hypothetical protein
MLATAGKAARRAKDPPAPAHEAPFWAQLRAIVEGLEVAIEIRDAAAGAVRGLYSAAKAEGWRVDMLREIIGERGGNRKAAIEFREPLKNYIGEGSDVQLNLPL